MRIVIFYNDYHGTEVEVNSVRIRWSGEEYHEHQGKRYGQEGKGGEET